MKIGVGTLDTRKADFALVKKAFDRNWISSGPCVREFEERFALKHGCSHGVMFNSGTDALRIALLTLKEVHHWADGDEVLVPSVTFVATMNVVLQAGLVPVIVDVGAHDYGMNPDRVQIAVTRKTRCMIPAHLFGQPCDIRALSLIATRHKLKLIEDSCETMGVAVDGKPVGSWGDIACFSTYIAHLIVTGVGGLATTNNPKYAEIMRSYLNHGRDPYYLPGYTRHPLSKSLLQRRFRFVRIGYSARPTEMQAALGLAQLSRLDAIIKARRANAAYLEEKLRKTSWHNYFLPTPAWGREHAYMMFPLVLKDDAVDKWDVCLKLEKAGIETREMLPLTNQPCYSGRMIDQWRYPMARKINKSGFYVGCHQNLKRKDLDCLAHHLALAVDKSGKSA